MDNSINFKGAFLINKPSIQIQQKILSKLGNNYQIIKNLKSEGDILYITEKNSDKKVAKFLTEHKETKFKYYPELSTESGFHKNISSKEITDILSNYRNKALSTISELNKIFKFNQNNYKFLTRKKDNTLEKSMKTLDLNPKDFDIKKLDGFSEIYTKDKDKKLVAIISEPDKNGFRYARLEPQKPGDTLKRYAVLPGEKFTYINNPNNNFEDATTDFMKNYMRAVNANRVTHNGVHQ